MPILYDKSSKDFKDKHNKERASDDVATEVDFSTGKEFMGYFLALISFDFRKLNPKYNPSLNKFLSFLKLIGERIFQFGRIIDIPSPVEVEKHLVQVCTKASWGESSCDIERGTVYEWLLGLFTVS